MERIVRILNIEAGLDVDGVPSWKDATPEQRARGYYQGGLGWFVWMGAYGGWKLERVITYGGGVRDVLRNGYQTKREAYHGARAFLEGMRAARDERESMAGILAYAEQDKRDNERRRAAFEEHAARIAAQA